MLTFYVLAVFELFVEVLLYKKHPAIAAPACIGGNMAAAKVRIVSKTALTPAARMCCELHQRTQGPPS